MLIDCEAVRGYDDRIFHSANELSIAFAQAAGAPVDITTWFQYFAFDVMGELGFGKSFHQVQNAKSHFQTDFLRKGMSILAIVTPVPWLYHLALSIPGLTRDWQALLSWSVQQVKQRLEVSQDDRSPRYTLVDTRGIGASSTS